MNMVKDYIDLIMSHKLYKESFPRHMNVQCLLQLAPMIWDIKAITILEIGRSAGFSMGFFAFMFPDATIVSIDIVHNPVSDEIVSMFPNRCIQIVGTSNIVTRLPYSFDIVLIDGSHTYAGCKLDWDNIQNCIRSGTVVIFDDLDSALGCGKVFYDIQNNTKRIIRYNNSDAVGVVVI